jgi:hypothetical protein
MAKQGNKFSNQRIWLRIREQPRRGQGSLNLPASEASLPCSVLRPIFYQGCRGFPQRYRRKCSAQCERFCRGQSAWAPPKRAQVRLYLTVRSLSALRFCERSYHPVMCRGKNRRNLPCVDRPKDPEPRGVRSCGSRSSTPTVYRHMRTTPVSTRRDKSSNSRSISTFGFVAPALRLCHGNEGWFGRGEGPVGPHAAATASCHCAAASVLKIRSVDREIRWRWRLKVL